MSNYGEILTILCHKVGNVKSFCKIVKYRNYKLKPFRRVTFLYFCLYTKQNNTLSLWQDLDYDMYSKFQAQSTFSAKIWVWVFGNMCDHDLELIEIERSYPWIMREPCCPCAAPTKHYCDILHSHKIDLQLSRYW